MKILYDYTIFRNQRFGGISRYFCELINRINEESKSSASTHCLFNINENYGRYFNKKVYTKNILLRALNKIIDILNLLYFKIACPKCDIIHSTYYNPNILSCNKKMVITVYDMIHELFSDDEYNDRKLIENKKKSIYGCDHIIAISKSTKNDILKLYPDIPESKISVIYIGTDLIKCSSNEDKYANLFPKKYVLFVGNRGWYKNFDNFFVAMKKVLTNDKEMNIVCCGGPFFSNEEKELISGYEKQVIHIKPNDAILKYAYKNALCFVFPSKYEGFGIPVLESFSFNCPAVLSRRSSLPEVGGEAAVYFDPDNIDDIRDKVESVIYNDVKRNELIVKGKEQMKKFSWSEITEQTLNCYERVLNEEFK